MPGDYRFDVDFNGFLLNQAGAEEVLQQLDDCANHVDQIGSEQRHTTAMRWRG